MMIRNNNSPGKVKPSAKIGSKIIFCFYKTGQEINRGNLTGIPHSYGSAFCRLEKASAAIIKTIIDEDPIQIIQTVLKNLGVKVVINVNEKIPSGMIFIIMDMSLLFKVLSSIHYYA